MDYNEVARGIIVNLEKEMDCYEVIYKFSVRQKEALERNDTDSLLGILNKKQKLIGLVNTAQEEVKRLKLHWDKVKDKVPQPDKARITELTGRIARLLEDTVILEKENINIGMLRSDALAKKVKELRQGRHALKKYSSFGDSLYTGIMDKKS